MCLSVCVVSRHWICSRAVMGQVNLFKYLALQFHELMRCKNLIRAIAAVEQL